MGETPTDLNPEGVALDDRVTEQASFDVGQSLRKIRPDVPIILLCGDQIDPLPTCVDACVTTGQSLKNLISAVRRLLTANRPSRASSVRFIVRGDNP
jgi:hypothetical protein